MLRDIELLAPAGNIENFFTALENGADGVYVGAPGFNARNLARELTIEEIAAMISHCRQNNKRIYIAANSLLLEQELPKVIETLALLEELGPDALIVQDIGLINLIRYYFPRLTFHISTLMGAHNLASVDYFHRLGSERVVLARELTLQEIGLISSRSEVELEVFVHGAMCYSYSGLCLFSSYLGGKSGLRGRCVQPCRRSYSMSKPGKAKDSGRKGNYLFSMNDLDGLEAVRELREFGVASLKIEGRLRSANYVEKVVKAYRLVLDAPLNSYDEAVEEASRILASSMSRKVSSGYFFAPQPTDAIAPYHSGNMGLHLGRAKRGKGQQNSYLRVTLKEELAVGDRVRFHAEPSGERVAATLKEIRINNKSLERGGEGEVVELVIPPKLNPTFDYVELYKVDGAADTLAKGKTLQSGKAKERIATIRRKRKREISDIRDRVWATAHGGDNKPQPFAKQPPRFNRGVKGKKQSQSQKMPLEWWLKLDSVKSVLARLPVSPDNYLISLNRRNVEQAPQLKRLFGKGGVRKVIWALPPIIVEKDLARYRKYIKTLLRAGYRSFQVGHISQTNLFIGERVFLSGDFSLNIINNQALLQVASQGFEAAQLSIEADRNNLRDTIRGYKQLHVPATKRGGGKRSMRLGLTVYGAPPLFTSRMDSSFLPYDRTLVSPKNENFVTTKGDGFTQTRPLKPFSLIPFLGELNKMGLDYVVMDLTGGHEAKKDVLDLSERLAGNPRQPKLSTFNYLGKLE